MTSIKKFTTALTLGLALAFSALAFAQNTTPGDGAKKESCCAMTSCAKGDSCAMKEGKGGMDHSCCKGDKAAAKKDGGCCGDSCNMKGMKHETKQGQ